MLIYTEMNKTGLSRSLQNVSIGSLKILIETRSWSTYIFADVFETFTYIRSIY